MLRGVRIMITGRAGVLGLTCNAERDDPGGEQIRALARELMEDADRMCRACGWPVPGPNMRHSWCRHFARP